MPNPDPRSSPTSVPSLTAIPLVDPTHWVLTPASSSRAWMDKVPDGHAYRCLPLVVASAAGWILSSPVDFEVVWNGQWGPRGDLLFTFAGEGPATEAARRAITSQFGSGIITFSVPHLFRTSEVGLGLRVSGAPNFYKFNCHALEGWVETWWLPFTFTMNWKIDAPYVPVQFHKGDPLCFIQPSRLDTTTRIQPVLETLESQPKKFQEAHREWARSRYAFNQAVHAGQEKGWQKHYQKGIDHNGGTTAGHSATAVRLPEFAPRGTQAGGTAGGEGSGIGEGAEPRLLQMNELRGPLPISLEGGGVGDGDLREEDGGAPLT